MYDTLLIAMGTHGRRGFARFVLGSVAESVVRNATQPVLTAQASATPREPAYDAALEEASERVIRTANCPVFTLRRRSDDTVGQNG